MSRQRQQGLLPHEKARMGYELEKAMTKANHQMRAHTMIDEARAKLTSEAWEGFQAGWNAAVMLQKMSQKELDNLKTYYKQLLATALKESI